MGKAFGLVLMVIALWAGLEIYTEGMQGAFGGVFAATGVVEEATPATPGAPAAPRQRPTEAVRDRVTGHMELGESRRDEALDRALE
jgi:hypothetical protein